MEYKRQRKGRYIGAMVLLGALMFGMSALQPLRAAAAAVTPTPEPQRKLSTLTAVYTGKTVLVGHSIDLKKMTVMGLYTDGSYEAITGYALSEYIINKAGRNEITVSYEGVTTKITIEGKKVSSIFAYYKQGELTVGDQLKKSDLVVWVTYSDGSGTEITDYTLPNNVIKEVGVNTFVVSYEGQNTTFTVMGKKIKLAKELYAYYNGPSIIVGGAPKHSDFVVTVIYNDNTIETITDFEVSPSVVQKEGENKFLISKGELTTEAKMTGLAKKIESIKAEYTGFPLVIGSTVNKEDIKVTATYNDESKDTVKSFTLSSPVVYQIGDNVITVFCDQATATIKIRGVEGEIIDFNHAAEKTIVDGNLEFDVSVAMNEKADPDQLRIRKIASSLVKKAMQRIINTEKYVAVDFSFDDPELAIYLPMTVRVTVPEGYNRENFGVFYTTNRKTIMAQMNGTFLKDGTYEFKMFQPGTYIIADCTKKIYVEEIIIDEDELVMSVGKSYSLRPVIHPFEATNQTVSFSSSRPQIATVNEDGLITAVGVGSTVITVEAQDGSGRTAYVLLRVKKK